MHYSVVLTSCGRFDLLARTIASFLETADIAPSAFFVTEDSGDEAVRDVLSRFDAGITLMLAGERLGQMRAIDGAYARVTTPYIFHCEDDWEFFRSGYLADSRKVLDADATVSMVGLRPRADMNPRVADTPVTQTAGVGVLHLDPARHPEYFSYAFNPGLRRLADYRRVGPFAPLGGEPDVSYAFKKAGFHIADLEVPAVRHIGDDRHVHDPFFHKRPTNFIERQQNSVRKRWKRLKRRLNGA